MQWILKGKCMNAQEVIEIGRQALWLLIVISAPVMIVTLIVGIAISLFQALTQIQEMTLTFVPKIVCVFFTLMIAMPFMLDRLIDFTEDLYDRIVRIGESDREL